MSWSHIQGGSNHGNPVGSITVTLGSSTPIGRIICVGVAAFNQGSTSVTDSAGNTYTKVISDLSSSAGCEIWKSITTISGTLTVTVHYLGGSTFTSVSVDEFSATGTITADGNAHATGTSTAPASGNATVSANDLVYAVVAVNGAAGTYTAGGAYTISQSVAYTSSVNLGIATEYLLNTMSSPAAPTMTLQNSVQWTMVAAAFQETAIGSLIRVPFDSLNYTADMTGGFRG